MRNKKKSILDLAISNPDKILYPEQAITKLDLIKYYYNTQDWILPYIINRPLTIVRCPQGYKHTCFYQKHLNETSIENIYTIDIEEKHGKKPYLYIKNAAGLLALIQLNVLEIHTWGCHIKNIEKPDLIIFDLDPAPEIKWKQVIEAAFFVKEHLAQLGLTSFVKTTGGKGLHVVLPFQPQHEWEKVEIFAKTFVHYLVSLDSDKYIATMSKEKRKGKIYIDYLRNKRGATAVAPYSTRAIEHATIATPLAWNELSLKTTNEKFNIQTINKRLNKLKKDPWTDFFEIKQKLKLP